MATDDRRKSGWRDVLLALGPARLPSSTPSWVSVTTTCLDLVALLLLGLVTALLRFGNVYLVRPQLKGFGGLCADPAYGQSQREPTVNLELPAVYALVIAAPVVIILLLELLLARANLQSLHVRPVQLGESVASFFRQRFAKMLMVFLLGLCIASTVTDVLRILIARPRPYFLSSDSDGYLRYCTTFEDHDMSPDEREARLSFPSYRCSMLAFSGAVVALHSERVLRRLGGLHVLRGLIALAAALPAAIAASQALDARTNHWQDVVVGLLLGAFLGAYVVLQLGRDLGEDGGAAAWRERAHSPYEATNVQITLPRPRTKPVSVGAHPAAVNASSSVPVLAEATDRPYLRLDSKRGTDDALYY